MVIVDLNFFGGGAFFWLSELTFEALGKFTGFNLCLKCLDTKHKPAVTLLLVVFSYSTVHSWVFVGGIMDAPLGGHTWSCGGSEYLMLRQQR